MSLKRSGRNKGIRKRYRSSPLRFALSLMIPLLAGLLVSIVTGPINDEAGVTGQSATAPILAALGIVSWLIGLRWYGTTGMGLRGGRPLFAGIGFASLGWLSFLIGRFIFVQIVDIGPPGSGRTFVFLLLFEAFAVQIWVFGLVFQGLALWRGPLTAAIVSGLIFGTVAFLLFQESFTGELSSLLYFLVWGVFYGIIRLRTGSLLGPVTIQALHSFTSWAVFAPAPTPVAWQLQRLYLVASLLYLFVIWRLWPKQESDYRV